MNVSETAALLAAQDHILILTHKRPDGDTIGCAAGLCAALRALGKTAWALPNSDVSSLFAPYLEPYLAPCSPPLWSRWTWRPGASLPRRGRPG